MSDVTATRAIAKVKAPRIPKPLTLTKRQTATLASFIEVTDKPSYDVAGARILALRDLEKRATAHFQPALDALKTVTDLVRGWRDGVRKPAQEAIKAQTIERARWAEIEEARQRAINAERDRALMSARAIAQEAEIATLRQQAESVAALLPEVSTALLIEAEQVAAQPVTMSPAPSMAMGVSVKTSGLVDAWLWSAACDDLSALVRAVCAGKLPVDVLMARETYLNQRARDMKDESAFAARYPGCRAIKTPSARASR